MGMQSAELRKLWQRGPKESTNRLFRQYFPKGTDFVRYSRDHLNKVARQLNERPARPWSSKPRRSGLTPVLRRPVEITAKSGHSLTSINDAFPESASC